MITLSEFEKSNPIPVKQAYVVISTAEHITELMTLKNITEKEIRKELCLSSGKFQDAMDSSSVKDYRVLAKILAYVLEK